MDERFNIQGKLLQRKRSLGPKRTGAQTLEILFSSVFRAVKLEEELLCVSSVNERLANPNGQCADPAR